MPRLREGILRRTFEIATRTSRQAETGVAVSPEDGQSKAKAAQEWLAYLWVTGALRIEGS